MLKKLIAGTISDEELFWVEEQAIYDNLLFEAIKGFNTKSNHTKNVSALRAKIGAQKSSRNTNSYSLLKWAAVVFFLLGSFFLTYTYLPTERDQGLAATQQETKTPKMELEDDPRSSATIDSIAVLENQNLAALKETDQSTLEMEQPTETDLAETDLAETEDIEVDLIKDSEPPSYKQKTNRPDIAFESEKLLPSTTKSTEPEEISGVEDIAMATDNAPVPDTYSKTAQEAATMAEMVQAPNPDVVITSNPIPDIGIEAFEKKINNAIKNWNGKNGQITLQFEISEKGIASKFKVLSTKCSDCKDISIKLLKSVKKWKNNLGKAYTSEYTFHFN